MRFGPALGGVLGAVSLTAPFWFAGGLAALSVALGLWLLPETNLNPTIQKKEPLFNDAYLIAGRKNEKKYLSVLNSLSSLWKNADELIYRIDKAKTPEESFNIIKEIDLVGDFLAYEIWTDLTYFNFFSQGWTDNDFVSIGPGAKWGLEIIYGKSDKKENLKSINHLHEIQKEFLEKRKNHSWQEISYKEAFSNKPFLSLRNIEHSLCEFRKYHNLKNGKGKRRFFQLS